MLTFRLFLVIFLLAPSFAFSSEGVITIKERDNCINYKQFLGPQFSIKLVVETSLVDVSGTKPVVTKKESVAEHKLEKQEDLAIPYDKISNGFSSFFEGEYKFKALTFKIIATSPLSALSVKLAEAHFLLYRTHFQKLDKLPNKAEQKAKLDGILEHTDRCKECTNIDLLLNEKPALVAIGRGDKTSKKFVRSLDSYAKTKVCKDNLNSLIIESSKTLPSSSVVPAAETPKMSR